MLLMGVDQLTPNVGATKRVKDGEAKVAGPAVVHGVSLEPLKNADGHHRLKPAFGVSVVVSELLGGRHMQPLQLLAHV